MVKQSALPNDLWSNADADPLFWTPTIPAFLELNTNPDAYDELALVALPT
jgi:hypothetical protein